MLLRILSDAHLEFLGDHKSVARYFGWDSYHVLPKMDNDKEQILILAGDIIMLRDKEIYEAFFQELSDRFQQVFIICGNHEFYRYEFVGAYKDYAKFLSKFHNITLLQDSFTSLNDDWVVFGATMWTNFNKRDPSAMLYAPDAMTDFRVIKVDGKTWTPEDSVKQHEETIYHMREFFKKNEGKKKLVVTHHLPSEICNDPRFKGSMLNPAFSSNLDDLIFDEQPNIWAFGHTHHSVDTMLGSTRLICNPRGYNDGQENPKYNNKLVIEV